MTRSRYTPAQQECFNLLQQFKIGMESKAMYAPDAPGDETALSPEEIAEKVKLGLEKKKAFMPSIEEIKEKISAKMEATTEAMPE